MIKLIGGLACRICGRTDKHIHVGKHRHDANANVQVRPVVPREKKPRPSPT